MIVDRLSGAFATISTSPPPPNPPNPTLVPLASMLVRPAKRWAPPDAWMYVSRIDSGEGSPGTCTRTSSDTQGGMPYMTSMIGVTSGLSRLRWQVQQVTSWRPPKLVLLILVTMFTIERAIRFLGVSAGQSTLSVPAPTWQSEQSN